MPIDETPGSYALIIDRGYPVGASEQNDGRLALHTVIKNSAVNPIPFEIALPANPLITNVPAVVANVEVSHAFTTKTKKFLVRARNASRLQIAFVALDSNVKFITIPKGCSYTEEEINVTGLSIYVQANLPNEVIEIIEWF